MVTRAGALWSPLVVGLVLAGCGVPAESQPRPLPADVQVPLQSAAPAPTQPPAPQVFGVWFVKDERLVPRDRTSSEQLGPQRLLDLLVAGPTQAEADNGLRTAITSVVSGRPLVTTAEAAGVPVGGLPADTVALVLAEDFFDLSADEQILVLGQVVRTVAVPPYRAVVFLDQGGNELGVPTPSGRLKQGRVLPRDFAALTPAGAQ